MYSNILKFMIFINIYINKIKQIWSLWQLLKNEGNLFLSPPGGMQYTSYAAP